MSGYCIRKCTECGIHDGVFVDGLPVILADYGNDDTEWLLCDDCVNAIKEYQNDINTQRCLNNWIVKGVY